MEKYCRAERVIDDNMAHALCMLDTINVTQYMSAQSFLFLSKATCFD